MAGRSTGSSHRGLGVALVLTVASLVVQPLVAAATTTPFSWTQDAISDLGVTTCGVDPEISGTTGVVCSPLWPLMNGGIVLGGVAMVLTGLLLGRTPLASRTAQVLLVVAGLSTLAVGLVPLDLHRELHLAVATPLFPAQNLALLVLAVRLSGRWRVVLAGAGLLGLLGTLAIVVPLGVPFGVAERLGAYPAVVVLAALGVRVLLRGLPSPQVPQ